MVAAMLVLLAPQGKPAVTWDPADPSNYTRTAGRRIQYIIIHTVEGTKAGAVSWFQNPSSNVSAHYVVGHDGSIAQCVADMDIGWHAGNWQYNQLSIGIEHEGYAHRNTWTDAQMRASAALTKWLCETYGVPKDRRHIIGHNEVPGATHTDPGPYFDWDRYMRLVTDAPEPLPAADPALRPVRVTAQLLNVRSGPGTAYGLRGQIPRGGVYVSRAEQGGWHEIYFDGDTGWCWGGYLENANSVALVTVTASALNVREGPGVEHAKLGLVYEGQAYHRVSVSGEWYEIDWAGRRGWVHSGYVTVSRAGVPEPPPPPEGLSSSDNGDGSVTLSWAPTGDSSEIRMEYWNGTAYVHYASWEVSGPTFRVWPVVTGTWYSWTVRSRNGAGWSGWSQPNVFRFPRLVSPPAPTGLSSSEEGSSVLLSWQTSGEAVDDHEIWMWYWKGEWMWYGSWKAGTGSSFRVWPVVRDTRLRWQVRAHNPAGWGEWSAPHEFRFPELVPPPAPEGLQPAWPNAGYRVSSPVTVHWGPVGGAIEYQVRLEYWTGLGYAPYYEWSVTGPSLRIWPVVHGTWYRWWVRARNEAGWGPWSSSSAPEYGGAAYFYMQ